MCPSTFKLVTYILHIYSNKHREGGRERRADKKHIEEEEEAPFYSSDTSRLAELIEYNRVGGLWPSRSVKSDWRRREGEKERETDKRRQRTMHQ